MSVLQIGTEHERTADQWLSMLGNGTAFPRLRSWQTVRPGDTDQLSVLSSSSADIERKALDGQSVFLWVRSTG
jgi:hypothetical protein